MFAVHHAGAAATTAVPAAHAFTVVLAARNFAAMSIRRVMAALRMPCRQAFPVMPAHAFFRSAVFAVVVYFHGSMLVVPVFMFFPGEKIEDGDKTGQGQEYTRRKKR
jgi:hypothetical protein